MGLIPSSPSPEGEGSEEVPAGGAAREHGRAAGQGVQAPAAASTAPVSRETLSIPWIDSIVEGSSLGGRLKGTKGTRQSADGTTRIEWEIVEYDGDGDDDDEDAGGSPANSGKRKLSDRDDTDDQQMEGVSQQ